jgi:hypothetical protein
MKLARQCRALYPTVYFELYIILYYYYYYYFIYSEIYLILFIYLSVCTSRRAYVAGLITPDPIYYFWDVTSFGGIRAWSL